MCIPLVCRVALPDSQLMRLRSRPCADGRRMVADSVRITVCLSWRTHYLQFLQQSTSNQRASCIAYFQSVVTPQFISSQSSNIAPSIHGILPALAFAYAGADGDLLHERDRKDLEGRSQKAEVRAGQCTSVSHHHSRVRPPGLSRHVMD